MGLFMGAHAEQKEVNDTKLHLLQPDYNGLPYGIPTKEAVKADIDRVLSFLEETMPVEVSNGRLRLGGLRLTSYEAGVLYAAALDAAWWTDDQRYQRFATDRLQTMAELAPKVIDSIKVNRNYDRQMRLMVMPGTLDDAGAMCAAYCRLQLNSQFSILNSILPSSTVI